MKPQKFTLWLRVVAFLVPLMLPLAALRGEAQSTYRGFTIDESQLRNDPALAGIRTAIKEQIDIVFEVGLPDEMQKFFQHVPFVLVPADSIPRGSPGFYRREDRTVRVTSKIVATGPKPVLLHELMHAYHDQRLPHGFKNREVMAYFEKGKATKAYAPKSHMMQNQGEFFACAATAYLFGVTAQEPFNRDRIKHSQPEYFAYLRTLFGPNAGSFAGSLPDRSASKESSAGYTAPHGQH